MNNAKQLRDVPVEMSPEAFRTVGYQVVDAIADFLNTLPQRPVMPEVTSEKIQELLQPYTLPEVGVPAETLLKETAKLLFDHSTFNGHPRFWGYITSSAAPIGALGDLLAAIVNSNVGAWDLSPIASEIEVQTVRWLAELVGFPVDGGGLLLSGGNMANITAFWAARRAKADWDVRLEGVSSSNARPLIAYAADSVHTWLDKASDLSGSGRQAVRSVPTDTKGRLDPTALRRLIQQDMDDGLQPFFVIGTAGTVSTGIVDPLPAIADICRKFDLWFHVDGAYGAFAAMLPESPADIRGLSEADSVALDPHKWLYAPLEAGCLLVRQQQTLVDAFSYHPDYYHFDESDNASVNFHEYGPQNSRGFRALKVWLALRQAGRHGYEQMIRDDIKLAGRLYTLLADYPELEPFTHHLSITTFRYVPVDLPEDHPNRQDYLNELNGMLLEKLLESGRVFLSNAVINGNFVLRLCIVNFRTTAADVDMLPQLVVETGRTLH